MRLADAVEPRVLAAQLLQLGRVPRGLGGGQLSGDLLRPRERLAESGLHGSAPDRFLPVLLAEPPPASGRLHELLLPPAAGAAPGPHLPAGDGERGVGPDAVAAGVMCGRRW